MYKDHKKVYKDHKKVFVIVENLTIVGVCSSEELARKCINALEYLRGPSDYSVREYGPDWFKDEMILDLTNQLGEYETVLNLLNELKNYKEES